jgi:hypothetical protein
MPSPTLLTREEGELVLSLLEQRHCRIVGSTVDELGFDISRLVSAGFLQPVGTAQSVFTGDGAEAGFRDLARIDSQQPAYFDAADGMMVPPVAAITLYQLDLPWWLRWLAEQLDLVDAGKPVELVPNHAWDLGNFWVTDKTKVPVLFARHLHSPEVAERLRHALDDRKGRSGGVMLSTSRRRSEGSWPGGFHPQRLGAALTPSLESFQIDVDIVRSPYVPVHAARPDVLIDLSPDNRVLTIRGEATVFRGSKQQQVLRQLLEAYRKGVRVPATVLLSHFADDVDTLSKAFKGSPNWPTLQKYLHQKDGMCWIAI